MARLLCVRVAAGIFTVFVSTLVIFAMVRAIPGDPIASRLAGGGHSPAAPAALRQTYGLDRPLPAQYWSWLTSVLHGDFGVSLVTQQPFSDDVLSRIPRTVSLALAGLAIAVALAVPVAVVSARYAGSRIDSALTAVTSGLVSFPSFVLGTLLISVFAVQLRWLPVGGYVGPAEDFFGAVRTLVLPALSLGIPAAAVMTRVLRSSLLDEMQSDYIRTAYARGGSPRYAIVRHALRNASLPAVTIVGLQLGYLLGGAIVVEVVFSYPGVGLVLLNSITQRNYPVVQACLLFYAVSFVVVNLATDLLYLALNPRMKSASA